MPPWVCYPLPIADQHVRLHFELRERLDHRRSLTKREQTRNIRESRFGQNSRAIEHLERPGPQDDNRGVQPLGLLIIRNVGAGNRVVGS